MWSLIMVGRWSGIYYFWTICTDYNTCHDFRHTGELELFRHHMLMYATKLFSFR